MIGIGDEQGILIIESRLRFLERDFMLSEVEPVFGLIRLRLQLGHELTVITM